MDAKAERSGALTGRPSKFSGLFESGSRSLSARWALGRARCEALICAHGVSAMGGRDVASVLFADRWAPHVRCGLNGQGGPQGDPSGTCEAISAHSPSHRALLFISPRKSRRRKRFVSKPVQNSSVSWARWFQAIRLVASTEPGS